MSPFVVPIAFFISVAAIAIGVPIARAFGRRMDRQTLAPPVPPDVVLRLERIEQAVDSIAVEVERISEGQRFTTKLLSERSTVPAERASSGVPQPSGQDR
ncbi:MAG TPA: hypothetical protein VFS05_06020 [Gemmatimonadaceae bacterium]|nr:hypothetical protein [Gemmatimonadaceae bacterium]